MEEIKEIKINIPEGYEIDKEHSTFDNILEAVLDWESARFTKPDKPLNAWNTCIQYYPEWKLYVEDILVKYKIPK